MDFVLTLLVLLQVKHWYLDFVDKASIHAHSQSYNDGGVIHSIKHGIGTAFSIYIVLGWQHIEQSLMMGMIDAISHYYIDWLKSKYRGNNSSLVNGSDQLGHQLVYIAITYTTLS